MNYTVKAHLSSGKDIVFGAEASDQHQLLQSITKADIGPMHRPWYQYKNANGTGFFKKDEIIAIEVQEK